MGKPVNYLLLLMKQSAKVQKQLSPVAAMAQLTL